MKEVKNEIYCHWCGNTARTEYYEYECPKCHKTDGVHNSSFIICDCGTRIYTDDFTNVCPECGKLYNNFGQELAPAEEWEEEDRYACFGPQNDNEDY